MNGVREGVDVSTGVWSDSDSLLTAEEEDVTGLLGIVIFGLGFSTLIRNLVDVPGTSGSSRSILMPKEDIVGTGSESESASLQIGRWASRTSSSLSFSFSSAAISFCKRDFSSSSWSVSYTVEKEKCF